MGLRERRVALTSVPQYGKVAVCYPGLVILQHRVALLDQPGNGVVLVRWERDLKVGADEDKHGDPGVLFVRSNSISAPVLWPCKVEDSQDGAVTCSSIGS